MSIYNLSNGSELPLNVSIADGFLARLVGLTGRKLAPASAFYITPCQAIHTIGMKSPIDVAFVNDSGVVLKTVENLAPNHMSRGGKTCHAVLEFPVGTIQEHNLKKRNKLMIRVDKRVRANFDGIKRILHWPANLFIALLWAQLVLNSFLHWFRDGEALNMGLVLLNSILFFLFLTRRESKEISNRPLDWIVAVGTVALSMVLSSDGTGSVVAGNVSIAIQSIALVIIIASVVNLGRSFGIVPANRNIKIAGIYGWVRHPLYASELLFYFGFLLGNASAINFLITFLILSGQVYRVFSEERLLKRELKYLTYTQKVRYRFFPGVF